MNSNNMNQYSRLASLLAVSLFFSVAHAATLPDPDNQPFGTLAKYALKSTDINAGSTKAYRPWLDNIIWQGDLIEYSIDADGLRSTDVDYNANPPTTGGSNWSARTAFIAAVNNDAAYWTNSRQIITSTTGRNQMAFLWNNLPDTMKLALDSTGNVGAVQNNILDYVRGDRSQESNGLRQRDSLMGDIIHSNPTYIGKPVGDYTFSGYATFKNTARDGRIYVGANDGMLHVFDESDGSEVYAYIPSMLINKLKLLSNDPYTHSYYVDGKLGTGDAYISSNWKTILAGGMGAGAKGLFVLDVTNPDLSSESANTGNDKKILWEISGADANLGHIHGSPSIVKLSDDKWYVVSANGYGSTNGSPVLYLVDIESGAVTTMTAMVDSDNGLSAATLIDINNDYIADYAYAGDLKGNLWRFDLSNLSSTPVKLFSAGIDKPITMAPDVTFHPYGDNLVYFGTGALLSGSDVNDTNQQSIFAIWDRYSNTTDTCESGGAGDLLCQSISVATHNSGSNVRVATNNAPDWTIHKGWRIDLPETGERLLGHPQLRGGRLEFISANPTVAGGNNWSMYLDYLSGGDSGKILFDLNNNQTLEATDMVSIASVLRTPIGFNIGAGYLSQPTIAKLIDGIDVLYINGLNVDASGTTTVTTVSTGSCQGGIALGHFDLDTDKVLGDKTDSHTHEYDDKYNVTYIDYFNLLDKGDNVSDGAVGIDPANQKLVALIANADLSPGGILTIGDQQWNVVAYQKMVQQQLESWDGISPLLDDNGNALAFTLNQINSAVGGSGTLRMTFSDQAIITGGLIPTKTGCVNKSSDLTSGRWRNGALTMHLLDLNSINVNGTKGYVIQNPSDLVENITVMGNTISLNEGGVKYGGLIGALSNPGAFVYESTLFWHHKGDCYGESNWEADRKKSTLTVAEVQQFLTDLNALVGTELTALKNYVCQKYDKKKGTCKDSAYKTLIKLIDKVIKQLLPNHGNIINAENVSELLVNVTTTSTTATVSVTDSVHDLNPVLGPTSIKGKVSWIDLRR